MQHVYSAASVAFFLAIPLWYLPNIINDMCHPETWDFRNDPRVWLPVLTALFTATVVLANRLLEDDRRRGRRE